MADYAQQQQQQQQYPNLNPYSGANGQNTGSFGSNASTSQQVEGTKNTMMSSEVSADEQQCRYPMRAARKTLPSRARALDCSPAILHLASNHRLCLSHCYLTSATLSSHQSSSYADTYRTVSARPTYPTPTSKHLT